MFASARKAARLLTDPAFFGVIAKALGLTLLLFALAFAGTEYLLHSIAFGWHWLKVALDVLAPILFLVLTIFLGAPVAAIFASLFLDEIAQKIEQRDYPADPPAPGAPFWRNLGAGFRLASLVIGVNLALLPLDLALPGIAELMTVLANGWLLGREYFELAALRHLPRDAADNLRRRHAAGVLTAGTLIALLSIVPVVNLFAPLFGTAFMVHLFKFYSHQDAPL